MINREPLAPSRMFELAIRRGLLVRVERGDYALVAPTRC